MDNYAFKTFAIELMNKLLDELDGDTNNALFVACGMAVSSKQCLLEGNSRLTTLETHLQAPTKRKRGRPSEYVLVKRGLMPQSFTKTQLRAADKKKRLGAPQKVNFRGMPTKLMALTINSHYVNKGLKNFRQATRDVLTRLEITHDDALVKRLAEQAGRLHKKSL